MARSHVGKVRQINEDRFLMRTDQGLWAVADGMGGHTAGGDAADVAIEELAAVADDSDDISAQTILAALDRANQRIHQPCERNLATSGATIVVAWLSGSRLTVFWAGDSRAYCVQDARARCLTRDHSFVQKLVEAGTITENEASRHPKANVVTRALGAQPAIVMEQVAIQVRRGDRILLCSDGLSRSLSTEQLRVKSSIDEFASGLLRDALQRDGGDNITLVALELGEF